MLLSLSSRSRPLSHEISWSGTWFVISLPVFDFARDLHLPQKEFFGFQAHFFYAFQEERKFFKSSSLVIHSPQRCIDIYRASSKCHVNIRVSQRTRPHWVRIRRHRSLQRSCPNEVGPRGDSFEHFSLANSTNSPLNIIQIADSGLRI
jgi:hypothetical protein